MSLLSDDESGLRDAGTDWRRSIYLWIGLIAACVHLAVIVRAEPLQSANDRSRWCTIAALLEEGTYQIDEIRKRPGWNTIDLVHVDGHFYSTKPPLLATVAAGVTWCVERTTGWRLAAQTQAVAAATLIVLNWLPFCLSLYWLASLLERTGASSPARVATFGIACFGTLLTPFLSTLNNHTVAAASAVAALWSLMNAADVTGLRRVLWLLVCGLAAGWTVCNELPAAAMAALLLGLCLWRWPGAALAGFVPGAAVMCAAFLATNWLATGTWKPAYSGYGSDQYRFVIDGEPSYWMNPQGVDRNLDSPPVYLLHCLIGHHGIWSLTPVWLLVVASWLRPRMLRHGLLRMLVLGGAGVSVVVLGFYLTRTENYNYGGVSCALRWMLWLIPFWLLALPAGLDALWRLPGGRWLTLPLMAVSVFSAWEPLGQPWQQPWLFRQMDRAGWIDYSTAPPPLHRTLWTWFDRIPGTSHGVEFVEFTSPGVLGETRTWRFSALGDIDVRGAKCIEVESRLSGPGQADRIQRFAIDQARFEAGDSPGKCLVWLNKDVELPAQMADLALVRGLPLLKQYHGGTFRYVHTGVRRDAFRCQRAAAQLEYAAAPGARPLRYRTDLWLTPEVPFGAAQLEFTVSDPASGQVLRQERWTVNRVSSLNEQSAVQASSSGDQVGQ
jgi:hypothetical protein